MTVALAACAFARGEIDGSAFADVFTASTLYCHAPESPGFVPVGEPGHEEVPVFTSPYELALYGQARGIERLQWFSTTGEDILQLLPDGFGIVVDIAGETTLRLPATAIGDGLELRPVSQ
jgi:hypothetical protein